MQSVVTGEERRTANDCVRASGEVVETVSSPVREVGRVRVLAVRVRTELIVSNRCENGLNVETTAWEGWKARQDGGGQSGA
jgi:hypothetical protein